MASRILVCLLLAVAIANVECNQEGDVLNSWKTQLVDPNNVLQSWDPTLFNPCTWFHVTCNNNNSVTRVDLGNAGLSGPLIPELGLLANLQYLEVFGNNITGTIPTELGNLTNLVSLDLYHNKLTGPIPVSLGNLVSLLFMRLHGNKLTGTIPTSIINLITTGRLRILNVSYNLLSGTVHRNNSTEKLVVEGSSADFSPSSSLHKVAFKFNNQQFDSELHKSYKIQRLLRCKRTEDGKYNG